MPDRKQRAISSDARDRLRDAGLEIQAADQAESVEAKIHHMIAGMQLLVEASQRIATFAGVPQAVGGDGVLEDV